MTSRILTASLLVAAVISAAPAAAQESGIAGQWKGTLNAMDIELRLVFKFRPQPDGSIHGTMIVPDQSPDEIPLTSVVVASRSVTVRGDAMRVEFTGTLSADGEAIEGNWRQATMFFPLRIELEKREIDSAVVEKHEPAPAAMREWFSRRAIRLKTAEAGQGFDDLEPLKAAVGDARIVALGEATHGTHEFFQLKHRMLEFLVEEMGFRIFAIEANWTEALRVNNYVLRGEGDPAQALAGMYFWVWNTKEILALIEWMRSYNLDPAHNEKLQFLGFDMQFSHVALQQIFEYLQAVDPEYADAIGEPLQPLLAKQLVPTYTNLPVQRRAAIARQTKELVDRFNDRSAAYIEQSSAEIWSVAKQNAAIVSQAAHMYQSESPSVQARDRFMADNVISILKERPNKKAVLWAHNGHVGKQEYGPIKTMGMHLDEQFGPDMVVFGLAFHRGAFRAIEPGRGVRVFNAPAAFVGGLDQTLATIGLPLLAVDLRPAEGAVRSWLDIKQRTWSIGAVFSEELSASYQQLIAPRKAFDILLFVQDTTASQPVPAE